MDQQQQFGTSKTQITLKEIEACGELGQTVTTQTEARKIEDVRKLGLELPDHTC